MQKSQFGEYGYLNIGFWFKPFGPGAHVPLHKCDVQLGATSLAKGSSSDPDILLNFAHVDMSEDERERRLSEVLNDVVIPFLDDTRSVGQLAERLHAAKLSTVDISAKARNLLLSAVPEQG